MKRRTTNRAHPLARIGARLAALMLAAVAALAALPAWAAVTVHFQSFNGSVLFGRYPHTFVVLDGTLALGSRSSDEDLAVTL